MEQLPLRLYTSQQLHLPDDHAENLHETESTMAMDVDSNTGIDRCSQPAAASMDFAVSPFPDCNTEVILNQQGKFCSNICY